MYDKMKLKNKDQEQSRIWVDQDKTDNFKAFKACIIWSQ